MHGSRGAGDSPGAADSCRGQTHTQKSYLIFSRPRASNHSPDNPPRLITMAAHVLPDVALSASDAQIHRFGSIALIAALSVLFSGKDRAVYLFSGETITKWQKERWGKKINKKNDEFPSVVASFKIPKAWQESSTYSLLPQQVSLYPTTSH